jgi:hypothetical protein
MDQGKNKGVGGKRENAKSVRQMTNIKRRKSNETRSVNQCGEIMVEDEGMRSKQGEGNTGTELARRRTQVASPRDPDIDPWANPNIGTRGAKWSKRRAAMQERRKRDELGRESRTDEHDGW